MNLTKCRHIALILATGGLLAMVMVVLAIQPIRAAGPWYVAPGGDDGNDCLSPATPCATISGAIGKASPGDTIYVAIGTYTGTGDEVVLIDKDITLSGGWDASFVIQSGTSTTDGEGSRRGITVNGGVTATVDRFTIQNGYTGDHGGGVYNGGILTLTSSTISENTASYSGGGIVGTSGSSTVIMDSQIYGNTAANDQGGGISGNGGDVHLVSSWVVGNVAENNEGGGVSVGEGGSFYGENCIIAGNYAGTSAGGLWLYQGGPFHLVNCDVVGNDTANEGGALATAYSSHIEITNTLIISNGGNTGIADRDGSGSVILLNYCDTYGNSPDGTGGVTIIRTNCLGTPPEDGLDPLMAGGTLPGGVGPAFADQWMSYDYRLLPGSPAIDAGTPIGAPPTDIEGNPRDALPDMGAYELVSGVRISPPAQTNSGARGEVVAHEAMVMNGTGVTDTFELALGSHAWDTALSTDSLGPIPDGDSVTFTVYVTVPTDVDWYSTDTVSVTATSVASPTVYSDTASFTTEAYAPPQISVSPDVLTSTQVVNEIVHETLTISNGNGVTLTFSIGIGRVPGGAALEFDGTDDQLNMGHSDVLMLSDTDFTVEAWISTTTTNTGWILGKHDPGWGNGYGLTVNHQDCAPDKACFDTAGDHMAAISTSDVNDGQWHHVAGVYNVSGTKRIYIDGTLEDTQPAPVSIPANTAPFRVGYLYDSNCCEQYQGQVDEVRVWNVARSEEEIQSTMHTPLVGVQPGLVGYWKLDEGSGQTAFDSTAHANNGQLGTTSGADPSDPAWFLISPQGGDLVWLTINPVTGTVPAYSSMPVQVTFDATGMELGDYTAEIVILSNDPVRPWVSVPVTMTVVERQAGLSLAPPSQEGSGLPGETVVYTLTVTNEGNYTDTFSLEASGLWTPTLPVGSSGPLGVGESFVFTLEVAIPATAEEGSSDLATVTARSEFDPEVSSSAEVTTTALPLPGWQVYLPLVLKNSE